MRGIVFNIQAEQLNLKFRRLNYEKEKVLL